MYLTCRRAKPEKQHAALAELDSKVFDQDAFIDQKYWQDSSLIIYWILKSGERVGVLSVRRNMTIGSTCKGPTEPSPGTLYVESIAILPAHQNSRVGTWALRWLLNKSSAREGMHRVVSNTHPENVRSQRLHVKCGFTRVAEVSSYYARDIDAIVYERVL